MERLAEVDDRGAELARRPAGLVAPDLPVEGGLERVLDGQRAALDDEHVPVVVSGTASVAKVAMKSAMKRVYRSELAGLCRAARSSRSRNSGSAKPGWFHPRACEAKLEKRSR